MPGKKSCEWFQGSLIGGSKTRLASLRRVAIQNLFSPATLDVPPEAVGVIVNHISEICNEWEWL